VSGLYLLRHAKAAPQRIDGDRDRPLAPAGRRDAQALAAWIAERRLAPALVLCSPALRARQTLDIIAPAFAAPSRIAEEDGLYLATAPQLLARLNDLPPNLESVMLIGHNPGLHELASILTDATSGPLGARLGAGLPAAALALFEVTVDWAALAARRARLAGLVVPQDLARRSF
jgi:phosphohistidine phosphatase